MPLPQSQNATSYYKSLSFENSSSSSFMGKLSLECPGGERNESIPLNSQGPLSIGIDDADNGA